MSIKQHFINAVQKAQNEEYCQEKLMKSIENSFDVSDVDIILDIFLKTLRKFYCMDYADKNPFIARGLQFLAKLAVRITLKCVQPLEVTNSDGTTTRVYDITPNPFFTKLMKCSLKYSVVEKSEVRFNTCYFIMILLQNIGNNVEMDYTLCDSILDSLKDLLYDPKVNVRLQALKALVRLQEPRNSDCVVLRSFLQLFSDPNSEIRKLVSTVIAPHSLSFVKIRERLMDTDIKVREAAYKKCADTNPKYLKIVDRNLILTSGFTETNVKLKKILTEKLLPKWLNAYNGNYLDLLKALKLDADENDLKNFEDLCNKVMAVYLTTNSFTDVIKHLPIKKEDRTLPIRELHLETVLYWSALIKFLRKTDDAEEYLETILPELIPFSHFLERVIKEKSSSSMDEWEAMEYQIVVYHLFQIASGFDMSEEAGRRAFYSIILQLLSNYKFQQKVTTKIIHVGFLLNQNVDTFTTDLCQVISEIREPLMDELPSVDKLKARDFEMTQLRVKLHNLEMEEEEALKNKDFQQANIIHNEYLECQRKLENLKNVYNNVDKVRVSKDDPETLCRCLDILMGVLKIPRINSMSSALRTCKDEFLMPILSNSAAEVHWRFISCLGLFALLDRDTAFQHANFICLPIATYRAVPNYDKTALKISVACVTDLIRLYGVKILGIEDEPSSVTNADSNTTNRRKLYSEDMNELRVVDKDDISVEFIVEIILDMLDDEDEDVRNTAASSITRIIVMDYPINPDILTRLILKWYDPSTEKKDTKLQQQIGLIIRCFIDKVKGAKEVIGNSVLPIIASLANASRNSSFVDVDIDNVLRFLSALTTKSEEESESIHNTLAFKIVEVMLNKPQDICNPHLAKLLTYLDVEINDDTALQDLISSVDLLLEDIKDKVPQKNLLKFFSKLKTELATRTEKSESNLATSGAVAGSTASESNLSNNVSNIPKADPSETKSAEVAPAPTITSKRKLYQANSDNEETDCVIKNKGNSSESASEDSDENSSISANVEEKSDVNEQDLKEKDMNSNMKKHLTRISEEHSYTNENQSNLKENGNIVEHKAKDEKESKDDSVVSESSREEDDDVGSNVFVKCDYTPLKAKTKRKTDKTQSDVIDSDKELKTSEKNGRNKSFNSKVAKTKTNDNKETKLLDISNPGRVLSPAEGSRRKLRRQDGIRENKANRTKVKKNDSSKKLLVKSKEQSEETEDKDSTKSLRSGKINIISNLVVNIINNSGTKKSTNSEVSHKKSKKQTQGRLSVPSSSKNNDSPCQTPNTRKNSSIRSSPRTIVPPKKLTDFDSYTLNRNASKLNTPKNKTDRKRMANTPLSSLVKRPQRYSGSKSLARKTILVNLKRNRTPDDESEKPNKKPRISKDDETDSDSSEKSSDSERNSIDKVQKPKKNQKKIIMRTKSFSSRQRAFRRISRNRISNGNMISRINRNKNRPNEEGSLIKSKKEKAISHSVKRENKTKSSENRNETSGSSDEISNSHIKSSLNTRNSLKAISSNSPKIQQTPMKTSRSKTKLNEVQEKSQKMKAKSEVKSAQKENKKIESNSARKEIIENEKNLRRSGRGKIEREKKITRTNTRYSIVEKTPKSFSEKKQRDKSVNEVKSKLPVSTKELSSKRNKKSDTKTEILQNLNSAPNKVDNSSSCSTKSLRLKGRKSIDADKSVQSKNSIRLNGSALLRESSILLPHTSTTAKSQRSSKRLNGSTTSVRSSRRNLNFSSSEETILKTFLQGDEELQVLEDLSIEDVTSRSNSSGDSKKENLIINDSSTSSSFSKTRSNTRRRLRATTRSSSDSDSGPRRKILRTSNSRILQSVVH